MSNKQKQDRNESARIATINKNKERKEKQHGENVQIVKIRNDYITNLVNGRFFLERCNMIATQLQTNDIKESIDGCPKPASYMRSEYAFQKLQAIKSMRNAHFAKEDLMKLFNHTIEEMEDLEKDYYDGKIIREDYDEIYKRRNKSQFVNSSKD